MCSLLATVGPLAFIERFGLSILLLLALGGMYLVAYVFITSAEKVVMKMGPGLVINTKNPQTAKKVRYVKHGMSLTLVGLIFYALYWSGPGGGLGGLLPSGNLDSTKAPSDAERGKLVQAPVTERTTVKQTQPEQTKARKEEPEQTITVEMLGGSRVQSQRFYLVKGEREPRNFAEVTKSIEGKLTELRSRGRPRLHIIIQDGDQSVAKDHPSVTQLHNWAQTHSLDVQTINYADSKSP